MKKAEKKPKKKLKRETKNIVQYKQPHSQSSCGASREIPVAKDGMKATELQTDDKLENRSFLDRLSQSSVRGTQRSHDKSPDIV